MNHKCIYKCIYKCICKFILRPLILPNQDMVLPLCNCTSQCICWIWVKRIYRKVCIKDTWAKDAVLSNIVSNVEKREIMAIIHLQHGPLLTLYKFYEQSVIDHDASVLKQWFHFFKPNWTLLEKTEWYSMMQILRWIHSTHKRNMFWPVL